MQIMPGPARLTISGVTPEELAEPRLNIEVGLDRLPAFHDHLGGWEAAARRLPCGLRWPTTGCRD
jgi:soluble lytic murein transglycosylase-like protein